jgi:hypothetical protein
MPPRRAKQAVWQASQDNMSLARGLLSACFTIDHSPPTPAEVSSTKPPAEKRKHPADNYKGGYTFRRPQAQNS